MVCTTAVMDQKVSEPSPDVAFLRRTHRHYPDALPDVLPLFAGIVLFTHKTVAHLLNMEPDWPWQKPTPKPLPSESITSRE